MSDSTIDEVNSGERAGRAPLRERLVSLLRRPEMRGMALVIVVKVMMVVLNFTLIALAARALDAEGFGYYSILFSAAGLLLIGAAAGQELFVIRLWNEFVAGNDPERLKGLFLFSMSVIAAAGAVIAAIFLPWVSWSFGVETAVAVTLFLLISAALQVSNHLLRTAVSVAAGDGLGNLLQIAPALAYLGWCLAMGGEAKVAGVFAFLAVGAFAGLLVHLAMMRKLVLRLFPGFGAVRAAFERRQWLGRSLRLWGANSLEAVNQHVDVLIIGFLLSPTVAGAYFVTVRLANLFAAAADSINLFATRHFSRLYFSGDTEELDGFLNSVAWITLAFIGVGMLGIAAGGYFALYFINPDYASYYPELLVLCLGTAALAVARPCGSILMLTGHEGRYLRIIAISVVVRVAALFALIPQFGVMGAVVATAASFVLAAGMMRRSAEAETGLDATVVRLMRLHRQTAG